MPEIITTETILEIQKALPSSELDWFRSVSPMMVGLSTDVLKSLLNSKIDGNIQEQHREIMSKLSWDDRLAIMDNTIKSLKDLKDKEIQQAVLINHILQASTSTIIRLLVALA